MAATSRTLRHARSLGDIEGCLEGNVRRRGNRLLTNWSPCCGLSKKRSARTFSITEYPDGLGAVCFRCRDTKQTYTAFTRQKGIRLGPMKVTQVGDDPGPFDARAEVLKRLDRERRVHFPPPTFRDGLRDQIGADADLVAGCIWDARARTKRLEHQPHVCPFSQRFTYDALLLLGRQVTHRHGDAVAARIRERSGAADYHYIPEHQVERRHYRSLAVHNLAVPRVQGSADADADADAEVEADADVEAEATAPEPKRATGPDRSVRSCNTGVLSSSLARFIGGMDRAHSPPSLPEEPPTTTREAPKSKAPARKSEKSLGECMAEAYRAWEAMPRD